MIRIFGSLSRSLPHRSLAIGVGSVRGVLYDAKKEYESLSERYKEAGGCVSCLREGKYKCEDPHACPEKEDDRELFALVRTSILDNRERIFSRNRTRAELQIPEKPPGPVSLDNWEAYFSSRGITGAKDPKYQRFLSKPLTFPLSVAQFFVENIDYPLTDLGKKSFDELKSVVKENGSFVRICFVGVRAELSFPATFWKELGLIFPNYKFSLMMIGPEAPMNLENQMITISDNVSLSCFRTFYHDIHKDLVNSNYVPDLFVGLNSGIGFDGYKGSWNDTFQNIMSTKKPFLLSSHDLADQKRDVAFLSTREKEFDWLLQPTPNKFKSLFYDVLSNNIRYVINSNWSQFAIQGK